RGGSDTSAVALAAALKADRCEILTDVKGLYTADPNLVPTAKLIPECSYETALEMSRLGAKRQARSIEVARGAGVNLSISSSRGSEEKTVLKVEACTVRAVTTKNHFHYFEFEKPAWNEFENLPTWLLQWNENGCKCLIEREKTIHVRKFQPKIEIQNISL